MKENFPIYYGKDYINQNNSVEGFPYFQADGFNKGSIGYAGQVYSGIPLMYDIVAEKLVTRPPEKTMSIQLLYEKIDFFKIYGHTFVKIPFDSLVEAKPQFGFYDQLFQEDTIQVLVKRTKSVQEYGSNQKLVKKFQQRNAFFIRSGKTLFRIKSASAGYKAFG